MKPWPIVDKFLKELPPGFAVADIGCGNGKYLDINPSVFSLGIDRLGINPRIESENR